jgi:protein ImuA
MPVVISLSPDTNSRQTAIDTLRRQLGRVAERDPFGVIGSGIGAVDACLPGGGLALGALHEIAPADFRAIPSASGFLLALASRALCTHSGFLVWPLTPGQRGAFGEPYAYGLKSFGLDPGRILIVRCAQARDAAWAMEEALRIGAAAVIGARERATDLTATRRFQLAAQRSGTPIFLLRSHDDSRQSAAVTRWRVAALPSTRDRFGLFAEPRWQVALDYARGGRLGEWVVEWNHAALCLCLSSLLADRAGPARRTA